MSDWNSPNHLRIKQIEIQYLNMHQILLVEDSLEYIHLVERTLGSKYQIYVAETLAKARPLLQKKLDLILLDISLPDGLGFDFCSEIRDLKKNECPPIIFFSGRTEVQDRIRGWSLGADDYITKPFSPAEFLVRVQNRIEKYQASQNASNIVTWGNVKLDLEFHEVKVLNGREEIKLDLTPIEFRLLYCLIKNADRVLTRTQLIDTTWGNLVHVTERTVDKHISTLRQKLNTDQVIIKAVSGLGYRLTQGLSAHENRY